MVALYHSYYYKIYDEFSRRFACSLEQLLDAIDFAICSKDTFIDTGTVVVTVVVVVVVLNLTYMGSIAM